MRLFVGIRPSDEVRDAIGSFIAEIRKADRERMRLVTAENIHLTLKFLGEIGTERVPDIEDTLARVSAEPFTLTAAGAGGFPSAAADARVLWTGVRRSVPLTALAEKVDRSLAEIGFPRESRPFAPHFTIARASGKTGDDVIRLVRENRDREFGSFSVNAIHLYVSESSPGGVRYTELSGFDLGHGNVT